MSIKELFGVFFANWVNHYSKHWKRKPVETQERIRNNLIRKAFKTNFGIDHQFEEITDYDSFKSHIPISDYEQFKPYIDRIISGDPNVTWPGRPIYLCKSSGTTSGVKYLPITRESLRNHINSARNAMLNYMYKTGNYSIINGKMIFLQGSPLLGEMNSIKTGRLSGIVAHHVPSYLQNNRLPSFKTNCIEVWEKKVEKIVEETCKEKMTVIAGIPPWLLMYFEKLLNVTHKKNLKEIFPELKLIITGGVNFEPYSRKISELLGPEIDIIELYPASEGFFAYQDNLLSKDLLLLLNENIFYEFIPADDDFTNPCTRISIKDVKLNTNYALVLNSNAGFWGYIIGDTIKFTSLDPFKIVVTGRIKHFISAFGEHVIAEEVESAISEIIKNLNIEIIEFTVAPQVQPKDSNLPYHEWYIEFNNIPEDIDTISKMLNSTMQRKNIYYNDLIEGKVLQPLKIMLVKPGGFVELMKKTGKYGGQNKVVHLSNNRDIANLLEEYHLIIKDNHL